MTAGERSGRDYGHDNPMWPAYDAGPPDDPASRHAAGPWADHDPWPADRPPAPQQPDPWSGPPPPEPWQAARPDPGWGGSPQPDPWSSDQGEHWSGEWPQRATRDAWGNPTGPPGYPGDPAFPPDPTYPDPSYPDPSYPGAGDHVTGHQQVVAPAGGPAHRPPAGRHGDARPGRTGRPRRRGLPLWQELPLLLVIAFCLAILVRTFLLQAFYIPSGSMEDTLIAGDRVLVNKVVYQFREPARGEVVVFEGTDAWAPISAGDEDIGTLAKVGRTLGDLVGISRPGAKDYIKRVIAVPGDTVSCCDVDGRVFVNGEPLDEAYVIRNSPLDDVPPGDCRSRRFDEVVVQPGQMFVMGDHRQVSQDSRCQGQVPIDNVIGRAFVIVWPSDRWATLSRPGTFDQVPQPGAAPALPAGPADTGTTLAFILPLLLPLGLHSTLGRRVPGSPRAPEAVGSRGD